MILRRYPDGAEALPASSGRSLRNSLAVLAGVIVAWIQAIALAGHDARRWEPKRFRARLFEIPATIVRRCRHKILHSRLIAFEGVGGV